MYIILLKFQESCRSDIQNQAMNSLDVNILFEPFIFFNTLFNMERFWISVEINTLFFYWIISTRHIAIKNIDDKNTEYTQCTQMAMMNIMQTRSYHPTNSQQIIRCLTVAIKVGSMYQNLIKICNELTSKSVSFNKSQCHTPASLSDYV